METVKDKIAKIIDEVNDCGYKDILVDEGAVADDILSLIADQAPTSGPFSEGLCPVVSLKDYTPIDEIKHVTYTKMEIEQTYNCKTCGPLQVINGVCVHTKPDEEHGA